jgi:hypothetical protein
MILLYYLIFLQFMTSYIGVKHLDGIVWLVLETLSQDAIQEFKSREVEHHNYLRSIDIDPQSNPGLWEEQQAIVRERDKEKLDNKTGQIGSVSDDGDYR